MNSRSCRLVTAVVLLLLVLVVGMSQALAEKILAPRALAMGSAGTALSGGLIAIQSNPAAVSIEPERSAEGGWLVSSNRLHAFFAGYTMPPTEQSGSSAFGVWRLKDDITGNASRTITYTMSYPMNSQTTVGVSLRHWKFSGVGASSAKFDGDVGVVINVDPDTGNEYVGIALRNMFEPRSFAGQRVARRLAIGGAYRSPDGVLFVADYDDVLGHAADACLRVGAEAMLTPRITGRMGFNDGDVTVGVGVRGGKYRVDYAFQEGSGGFSDYHLVSGVFIF